MTISARQLTNRALISLEGEELITFLQAIVSNDVRPLDKGNAVFAALLTPQGKILFDFFLVPHDGKVFLDCLADQRDDLLKRLMMYKLRAKVTIAEDNDHTVWAFSEKPEGNGTTYQDPRDESLGFRGVVAGDIDLPAWAEADYEITRIKAAVPELGKDFETSKRFLSDVNYDEISGVSYTKGCYVGQEVTARMKHRGGVKKRTFPLVFEGDAPSIGTPLKTDDKPAGEVMSSQGHHALALLRLDALERGEIVTDDGDKATLSKPNWFEA